ncbi:MAG: ATP-binding protein, partial [Myxococcota bacterium]
MIANQCAIMLDNLRTQEKIVHAAKLSSLGELVAGIAHEINNPLAAMMGLAQLTLETPGLPAEARRDVQKMIEQGLRVKRIVSKLMIFARSGTQGAERIPVNELVSAAIEFKSYDLRAHGIAVDARLDEAEPAVSANRTELEQVLIALLQNADQALAPRGHGTLRVATRLGGATVEIESADDGPGVSPELIPRIFDPFFTTKGVGEGTGLGLATVHGIVEQTGGHVEVDSIVGKGTIFRVHLPVTEGCSRMIEDPVDASQLRGIETVLLVEDEAALRAVMRRMLTNLGYTVLEARHGADAARISGKHDGPIDLLIT